MGHGDPSVHHLTARARGVGILLGHGGVGILLYTAALAASALQKAVGILHCIASRKGAVGSGNRSIHCCTAQGSGQWGSFCTLPHCREQWAVSIGDSSLHCCTARGRGQWAVGILLHIASLQGAEGRGQWVFLCRLPHCTGQWAAGSFSTLPHCRAGEGGRGAPSAHCRIAGGRGSEDTSVHYKGQWAVGILQHTRALHEGGKRWGSCCTLPHCRVQWAVSIGDFHYIACLILKDHHCV